MDGSPRNSLDSGGRCVQFTSQINARLDSGRKFPTWQLLRVNPERCRNYLQKVKIRRHGRSLRVADLAVDKKSEYNCEIGISGGQMATGYEP